MEAYVIMLCYTGIGLVAVGGVLLCAYLILCLMERMAKEAMMREGQFGRRDSDEFKPKRKK